MFNHIARSMLPLCVFPSEAPFVRTKKRAWPLENDETLSCRGTKSAKVAGSPRSLEAMLFDMKLFHDEGLPKLKKDELEHIKEG